jgi:hypothetical protein
MQSVTPTHPVEFDVEYPDRPLDRLSTLFRLIFALPILVVLAALGGPAFGGGGGGDWLFFIGLAGGLVVIPPLLTIVFRHKYPRSGTLQECVQVSGVAHGCVRGRARRSVRMASHAVAPITSEARSGRPPGEFPHFTG